MKYETYQTYEAAKVASSPKGFQRIRDDFAYNAAEAGRALDKIKKQAASWHVIGGEIYWTMPMAGAEKGMKILHRLELMHSCLHDGSFWRVIEVGAGTFPRPTLGEATLMRDEAGEVLPLSRSGKARRLYAKFGWIVTTEAAIYFAAKSDNPSKGRVKTTEDGCGLLLPIQAA